MGDQRRIYVTAGVFPTVCILVHALPSRKPWGNRD